MKIWRSGRGVPLALWDQGFASHPQYFFFPSQKQEIIEAQLGLEPSPPKVTFRHLYHCGILTNWFSKSAKSWWRSGKGTEN